jgi:hypothetical protein
MPSSHSSLPVTIASPHTDAGPSLLLSAMVVVPALPLLLLEPSLLPVDSLLTDVPLALVS